MTLISCVSLESILSSGYWPYQLLLLLYQYALTVCGLS